MNIKVRVMNSDLVKTNNTGKKLMNFLHPKLCPKVTPNPFAFEGYEASNLLNSNSLIRSRGFLVGAGKTAPVDLEFEFLCNVNISYIKMCTVVGAQRCTGIEIYSRSDKNSPYISIGKSIYDKPGILFCNRRFYKPDDQLISEENDKQICYFNSNTFNVFLNAASLKIVIFKTPHKTPCMGSVEVWGFPARSCSKVTVETVLKIVGSSHISKQTDTECRTVAEAVESQSDYFKIPSDFKDDLTYEIMTLPMTLPSGKTIDQSTLDKHVENEKSFGRRPGDPFTGKKFTDTCKPLLNVGLKSRIDMFLTQNGHREETFHIARILGNSSSNNGSGYFEETDRGRKRTYSENESVLSVKKLSKKQCGLCQDVGNLYVISSCSHIYCRVCVMKIYSNSECSVCKNKFKKENIVKYHH